MLDQYISRVPYFSLTSIDFNHPWRDVADIAIY